MEFMGGRDRRSHFCPQKQIAGQLQKSTWMFHSTPGKIFCGRMKAKLSCSEWTHGALCEGKKGTAHKHQNLIAAVKCDGGNIMVWGCFAVWDWMGFCHDGK